MSRSARSSRVMINRTAARVNVVMQMFGLAGTAAVVTGAGRGIGRASAIALAEAGADVVISARTADQLAEVAATIEGMGRRAVVVPADLSDLPTTCSTCA